MGYGGAHASLVARLGTALRSDRGFQSNPSGLASSTSGSEGSSSGSSSDDDSFEDESWVSCLAWRSVPNGREDISLGVYLVRRSK